MITLRELLGQLSADRGLAPDLLDRAAEAMSEAPHSATPWYIHLLVAFGSWVASILLIIFIFMLGIIESAPAAVVAGLLLCGTAIGVRRVVDRVSWLAQVPLAICLAGEVMVIAGIGFSEIVDGSNIVNLVLAALVVLQLGLIFLYRDWLHRFLSAWTIAGAVCGLLLTNDLHLGMAIFVAGLGWAAAVVWERESIWARVDVLVRPIAYGLVMGLLTGLIILVVDEAPLDWPASIGLAVALVYAAWSLLDSVSLQGRLATAACALLLLIPAWQTPGILGAVLVLVVGFGRGNRALVGLGGLFLAGFIGFYYYSLEITLLLKSLYLAGAGLLLLTARAVLARAAARSGLI